MPSAVIASYSYDASRSVLIVGFVSGLVYEYYDVPEEVYKTMKSYTSKGAFLNREIRNKYRFRKITSP